MNTLIFEQSIELAAHCGEYTEEMMLTAKVDPDITIYARIHATTELLVYTRAGCCFHVFEDFNGRVSVKNYTPGTWSAAIEKAYGELVSRKPRR